MIECLRLRLFKMRRFTVLKYLPLTLYMGGDVFITFIKWFSWTIYGKCTISSAGCDRTDAWSCGQYTQSHRHRWMKKHNKSLWNLVFCLLVGSAWSIRVWIRFSVLQRKMPYWSQLIASVEWFLNPCHPWKANERTRASLLVLFIFFLSTFPLPYLWVTRDYPFCTVALRTKRSSFSVVSPMCFFLALTFSTEQSWTNECTVRLMLLVYRLIVGQAHPPDDLYIRWNTVNSGLLLFLV